MKKEYGEIFKEVYIALLSDSASDHVLDTEDDARTWAKQLSMLAHIHASTVTTEIKKKK